jgi:hypothetical protein
MCVAWFIINTLNFLMLLLDPFFVDCLPKNLKILSNLPASQPASQPARWVYNRASKPNGQWS